MLDSAVLLEEADQAVSEAARIVAAPHLYPEPAIHRARVLLRIGTSRAVDVDSTVQAIATERRTAPASSVIAGAWKPLDPSLLTTAPPARRWLLRHPTRDGAPCAPSAGDGMLPRGKVGMLTAEGGAGKTHALVALGIAIVTGRPWLGHYHVEPEARLGRVLLALAEEDPEEIHRRLFDAAQAMWLDADERRIVAERLVCLPLAGRPVALVSATPTGVVESPELAALRERLAVDAGPDGWSLIVLDPLARWAGADTEADNTAATRLVQALETLTAAPGAPTVLVAHHSSKAARRTGTADARGVTGLQDAMRWASSLRSEGGDVYFRQIKSNYSIPMPDELRLVRTQGGVLRVASDGEVAERQARDEARADDGQAAKAARREARIVAAMADLVARLRESTAPVRSQAQLAGLIGGERTVRQDAISRLLSSGQVVARGMGPAQRYTLAGVDR